MGVGPNQDVETCFDKKDHNNALFKIEKAKKITEDHPQQVKH